MEIAGLLQRPAIKQAMARAESLAANQGRKFSFNVDATNTFLGGVPIPSGTSVVAVSATDVELYPLNKPLNA